MPHNHALIAADPDFAYREALNYVKGFIKMQTRSQVALTATGIDRLLSKVEKEFGVRLTKEVL